MYDKKFASPVAVVIFALPQPFVYKLAFYQIFVPRACLTPVEVARKFGSAAQLYRVKLHLEEKE